MQKVYYYIGHNNKTKELEIEKIEKLVSEHFEGFTASEVVGYWKGSKEQTLKIEVITESKPVELARIGKELRDKLDQESILMEIIESNCAFL